VPGRDRRDLEQCALAARIDIGELAGLVLPGDLQPAVLDPVVEPGAAKDELPQPVDERLAVHEREPVPVMDEVAPEPAPRLRDPAVGGQLDEICGLVLVELVALEQAELDPGRGHALLEVERVEAEAVTEEFDDVIVARRVARVWHDKRISAARLMP
jgi:hypothetical protein